VGKEREGLAVGGLLGGPALLLRRGAHGAPVGAVAGGGGKEDVVLGTAGREPALGATLPGSPCARGSAIGSAAWMSERAVFSCVLSDRAAACSVRNWES